MVSTKVLVEITGLAHPIVPEVWLMAATPATKKATVKDLEKARVMEKRRVTIFGKGKEPKPAPKEGCQNNSKPFYPAA